MAWLHALIDVPSEGYADQVGFWSRALGWAAGDPWSGHPELRSLTPATGSPYVHLQRIDGPPRVHLDVESADPDALAARALALGAAPTADHAEWRTLSSPGGLLLCILTAQSERMPPPVTWPDGHRTRLVQVCIDAPADAVEREVAFWRGLLGGRWADSVSPEFAGTWHDDAGSPLQLLFQRLDEPSGPVRAHLDLGTDDRPADARRLLTAGAVDEGPGDGWQVLRDPAGLRFCVTGNSPASTTSRDLG